MDKPKPKLKPKHITNEVLPPLEQQAPPTPKTILHPTAEPLPVEQPQNQLSDSTHTPQVEHQELQTELQPTATNSEPDSLEPQTPVEPDVFFQCVGVIRGDVTFSPEKHAKIKIKGKEYTLFYISKKKRAFEALYTEVENNGGQDKRLVVYPRILHLPDRNKPHQLAFQLVGFESTEQIQENIEESTQEVVEPTATKELGDFEFKISGLWQFIPVCKTPCISVFRNWSQERLAYVKSADPVVKAKFMKASHVPVLWKDAPVPPFRFNPKAEQQGQRFFVSIKTRFLPGRDVFGFDSQIAPPLERAPRFLKTSKETKAEALKAKRERRAQEGNGKGDAPKGAAKGDHIEQKTTGELLKAAALSTKRTLRERYRTNPTGEDDGKTNIE